MQIYIHTKIVSLIASGMFLVGALPLQSMLRETRQNRVNSFSVSHSELYKFEQKRVVRLQGKISDAVADDVINKLLYWNRVDSGKDIYLYIDSPGGSVTAGMAIYDTMRFVKAKVVTVNVNLAASMASFILAAGTKGKRFSLPHARIMIHQAKGDITKKSTDDKKIIEGIQITLNEILARNTGKSVEQVNADTMNDLWMSADEAKTYGIVDFVIKNVDSVN